MLRLNFMTMVFMILFARGVSTKQAAEYVFCIQYFVYYVIEYTTTQIFDQINLSFNSARAYVFVQWRFPGKVCQAESFLAPIRRDMYEPDSNQHWPSTFRCSQFVTIFVQNSPVGSVATSNESPPIEWNTTSGCQSILQHLVLIFACPFRMMTYISVLLTAEHIALFHCMFEHQPFITRIHFPYISSCYFSNSAHSYTLNKNIRNIPTQVHSKLECG